MDKDPKDEMEAVEPAESEKTENRRDFFVGLGKWSKIIIGAVVLGSTMKGSDAEAKKYKWFNDRCDSRCRCRCRCRCWTNWVDDAIWPPFYEDDSFGRCKCGPGWSNQRCWANFGKFRHK
jgi:hypothetical protein